MDLKKTEIADGVHAYCLATEKFKVNAITLNIKVPMSASSVTMLNLLSRVLKRGCKKYPDMKTLENKLDTLYGSDLNIDVIRRADSQFLCVSADFLSQRYTDGCDIIEGIVGVLADVLLHPLAENNAFCEKYVASEKKNLADAIDGIINNKAQYAKKRCIEEMCPDEPFSLPPLGDAVILKDVTAESLFAFYTDIVIHNRMEILYTGSECFFSEVCNSLKDAFTGFDRRFAPEPIKPEKHRFSAFKEITEDMPVSQGKLSMGFVTNTVGKGSELAALIVANEIFGGSPNSKLFMNVREKMSLCYYCSSSIESNKGIMLVNAGIENENFEITRDSVLKELDDVKNGNFSDADFENAVSSLVNGYKSVSDSVTSLEAWYVPRLFKDDGETVEDRINEIKAVNRTSVIRAAEKIKTEVVYFLRGTASKEDDNEQ